MKVKELRVQPVKNDTDIDFITLGCTLRVLKSLEDLEPKVELSTEIIERARLPLERMMKIGKSKNEK